MKRTLPTDEGGRRKAEGRRPATFAAFRFPPSAFIFFALALAAAAHCEQSPPAPAAPPVKDEELVRVTRVASDVFPWVKASEGTKTVAPPKPAPGASGGDSPMSGMGSGDVIIRELGDFSAAPGPTPDTQVLILHKDVEVDQIQENSVLRAQTFKITRNVKTGMTEMLEAHVGVEMVMPGQKAKGENLLYETRYGPHGEITKDLFTLDANRASGGKAYLWLGTDPDPDKNDKIEADRFINDKRLDTFRALGTPAAVVTMQASDAAPGAPPTPAPAPGLPPPKPAAAGMLPGMSSLTAGGLVRLQCDGEMFYEGSCGRLALNRNAMIQKESPPVTEGAPPAGIKLNSDEAHLIMDVPPPGQPQEGSGMLSGQLKSMECIGRVEIKTPTHVILCDRCTIDMKKNVVFMEMKSSKDSVRVFVKGDATNTGSTLIFRKSLTYSMAGSYQSPYPWTTAALPDPIPTNRPPDKK